jgi:hypothetical protein
MQSNRGAKSSQSTVRQISASQSPLSPLTSKPVSGKEADLQVFVGFAGNSAAAEIDS